MSQVNMDNDITKNTDDERMPLLGAAIDSGRNQLTGTGTSDQTTSYQRSSPSPSSGSATMADHHDDDDENKNDTMVQDEANGSSATVVAASAPEAANSSSNLSSSQATYHPARQSTQAYSQVEFPPPYVPSSEIDGKQLITCRVCGAMIDITNKTITLVVRCPKCNEATPIKPAPPEKKYIRCPCNCLLICQVNAQRIVCPRKDCRRIIYLNGSGHDSARGSGGTGAGRSTGTGSGGIGGNSAWNSGSDDMYGRQASQTSNANRPLHHHAHHAGTGYGTHVPGSTANMPPVIGNCTVICAHCYEMFQFDTLSNQLARCSHCNQLSSVGAEFARTRGWAFLLLSLIFLATGIGAAFAAHHNAIAGVTNVSNYLLIPLAVLLLATFVVFAVRACYFLRMKVSYITQNRNV